MSSRSQTGLQLRYPLASETAAPEHGGWRLLRNDLVEQAFAGNPTAWTKLQRESSRLGLLFQPMIFGQMECVASEIHDGTAVQLWRLRLPDQVRSVLDVDVNLRIPRSTGDRLSLAVEILRRAYLKVTVDLVRSRNPRYATEEIVERNLANLIEQVDSTETQDGPTDRIVRAATFDTIVMVRQFLEGGYLPFALCAITELQMRLNETGFTSKPGYFPAGH